MPSAREMFCDTLAPLLPPEVRHEADGALRRFAGAWTPTALQRRRGEAPPLLAGMALIDLDMRLRRRQRAQAAEYLERFPDLARAGREVRVAFLECAYRLCETHGTPPPLADFARQHPDLEATLLRRLAARSGSLRPAANADVSPVPQARPSAAEVLQIAGGLGLLPDGPGRLAQELPDPEDLAEELVRRAWLTPFQAARLLAGRGDSLALGPYLLLERLGEGGMGQVFKARHRHTGRLAALKVIREGDLADGSLRRRFRREQRAVARLRHPNVVAAYQPDRHSPPRFVAMEYHDGTDLGALLKRQGALPVPAACDYARQAALGLAHAHGRGVVHRDVKPSNLLLTPDGVVKVADWGLAKFRRGEVSGSLTRHDDLLGTVDYMAPEQAARTESADARADVYSLGCTLYHLLAGRPPFPGDSITQKLLKHQTEEPPPLEGLCPGLPPGLGDVVRRMMAKRAEGRYPTADEAAAALAPFCAVAPCEVPAAPANGQPPPLPRRGLTRIHTLCKGVMEMANQLQTSRGRRAAPVGLILVGAAAVTALAAWALLARSPRGETVAPRPIATEGGDALALRAGIAEAVERLALGRKVLDEDAARLRADRTALDAAEARLKQDRAALNADRERFNKDKEDLDCDRTDIRARAADLDRREGELRRDGAALAKRGAELDALGGKLAEFSRRLGADAARLRGDREALEKESGAVATLGDRLGAWEKDLSGREAALKTREREGADALARADYFRNLIAADRDVTANEFGRARRLLDGCEEGRRCLAWRILWATAGGANARELPRQAGPLYAVALSPDGKAVALAGDGGVSVVDLVNGTRLAQFAGPREGTATLAFRPDGGRLAAGGGDGAVRVIHLAEGRETQHEGHRGAVRAVAFSPDGKRILSAGADGMVVAHGAADGARLSAHRGHPKAVVAAAFSADGRYVSLAGEDGTTHIVEVASGAKICTVQNDAAAALAFSPDGALLASGGKHGAITVRKISDPARAVVTLVGHTSAVRSLAWSPDGVRLVSAGEDRTVKLWSADGPWELMTLRRHQKEASAVTVSRDGRWLVSGGGDGDAVVWAEPPR